LRQHCAQQPFASRKSLSRSVGEKVWRFADPSIAGDVDGDVEQGVGQDVPDDMADDVADGGANEGACSELSASLHNSSVR
jgi:hypothetical protein